MRTRLIQMSFVAVLAALLFASLPFGTNAASYVEAAEADIGIPVEVGGVVILRVRVPVDGLEPRAQVSLLYRRWVEALAQAGDQLSPALVRVEETDDVPTIYLGDIAFVTVDEAHARLNGTVPALLADVWANNLRRAVERYLVIHGK